MFVIVGAGLAGAKAAETLREEGYDGRLLLLGAEPERPYERPPLSKEYLRGEAEREDASVHAAGFYAEHDIELRTGTAVTALDAGARELELHGGERLAFDRLLLATGAAPRRLSLPARSSTASWRCGPSPTATPCGRASTGAAGWSWWGRAGSAPRSPRPRASAGWT
jgi:3-phenylpropionate/trans-cinnamate dioxygenase ferredoxin reductase component